MSKLDEMTDVELERLLASNKKMKKALNLMVICGRGLPFSPDANIEGALTTLFDMAEEALRDD